MLQENTNNGINNLSQINMRDALENYLKKDYEKLAFSDLKQTVNNDGDTVIHLLAKNLDKAVFELIQRYNPNAITYDIINIPNKKLELPIHKALETIKKNNDMGQDFISYMVNTLGANPDVPDANNRIIINNDTSTKSMYDIDTNKKELDEIVSRNIKNLTKLADTNTNFNPSTNNVGIEFIKSITNYYANTSAMSQQQNAQASQSGGYSGKRRIRNYFSDIDSWTEDKNNSFVTKKKNELLLNNNSMRTSERKKNTNTKRTNESGLRMIGGREEEREKYTKQVDELKLNEERLRNERLIGGKDSEDLRMEERRLRTEREKLVDEHNKLFGGMNGSRKYRRTGSEGFTNENIRNNRTIDTNNKKKKIQEELKRLIKEENNLTGTERHRRAEERLVGGRDEDWSQTDRDSPDIKRKKPRKSNNRKSFANDLKTDDFDDIFNTTENDTDFEANDRTSSNDRNPSNKRTLSDDDEDDDYDEYDVVENRQMFDYPGMFDNNQDRPRRERDTKVDDIYRSFVQKIMDLLGVDEETARFYRSAIKITIEENNPELRNRENDALKIKEMESIFENKNKLQSALDKIDMDKIKRLMSQKKEEGDKRREEWKKRNDEKRKSNSETSDTSDMDNKAPNVADTTTSDDKPKPRKRKTSANQYRVVNNGYLQSDEILFSPDI